MATRNADAVTRFYAAVATGDATALGELVDEAFAPDVVLSLPPSLPYGGEVVGAHRLRRMVAAMASATVGPRNIRVTGLAADADLVAAELVFDWIPPGSVHGVPSGATELWRFAAGRVRSIRAYYWDTAALLAPATR